MLFHVHLVDREDIAPPTVKSWPHLSATDFKEEEVVVAAIATMMMNAQLHSVPLPLQSVTLLVRHHLLHKILPIPIHEDRREQHADSRDHVKLEAPAPA